MQTKDKERFTILHYCQYLISTQINYTFTNLAEHLQKWSHDTLRRRLKNERVTGRMLWETVSKDIEVDEDAIVIVDDSVLDKNYSYEIETVQYQYSGTAHKVLKGIGIVNLVYVNPKSGKFWIIDFRIYNKEADGKTKVDHVEDMLNNLVHHKKVPFRTVLMDTWYATVRLMMHIDRLGKIYYCPIKENRLVNEDGIGGIYKKVTELVWNDKELKEGKIVKIKKFPGDKKVKLFRFATDCGTDFIVTNDLNQNSSEVTQNVCKVRWKIEEFHREIKQETGIEHCECRKDRLQRNHIGCAMLVWTRMKYFAYKTGKTIYQIKHGQLADYLIRELRNPSVPMALA